MFTNLVEETYRLIFSVKSTPSELAPDNIEQIIAFIGQIRQFKGHIVDDSTILYNNGTYLKVFDEREVVREITIKDNEIKDSKNNKNNKNNKDSKVNKNNKDNRNSREPETKEIIKIFEAKEGLKKINQDLIDIANYQFKHPQYVDMFPYLIKYYFRFFLSNNDHFRLLSSPLSFKPSSVGSLNRGSLENISDKDESKDIQYYQPLQKDKIVNLRKMFEFSEKSSPERLDSQAYERNFKKGSTYPDSKTSILSTDFLNPAFTLSSIGSPKVVGYERRFSVDSPMGHAKISVMIDYDQLADKDASKTPNARASHPQKALDFSSNLNPRGKFKHANPIRSVQEIMDEDSEMDVSHTKDSQHRIPSKTDITKSAKSDRSLFVESSKRDETFQERNSADESVLYTALHIPRKVSDSRNRIFAKGHLDDSGMSLRTKSYPIGEVGPSKTTQSQSARHLGFNRPNTNTVLSEDLLSDHHSFLNGKLIPTKVDDSKTENSSPTIRPSIEHRRKIFQSKEVFISPWEKAGQEDKGTISPTEEEILGNINYKKNNKDPKKVK